MKEMANGWKEINALSQCPSTQGEIRACCSHSIEDALGRPGFAVARTAAGRLSTVAPVALSRPLGCARVGPPPLASVLVLQRWVARDYYCLRSVALPNIPYRAS